MHSGRLRLSFIPYLNTYPFIYGLWKAGILAEAEMGIAIPSQTPVPEGVHVCLLPVGRLVKVENWRERLALLPFCIASNGNAMTVLLLSEVPLLQVREVYLDRDSVTATLMVRILAHEKWKLNVRFREYDFGGASNGVSAGGQSAYLAIGDKAFELATSFRFVVDVGQEWTEWSGLPCVFAVWVCPAKVVHTREVERMTRALEEGINNIPEMVRALYNGELSARAPDLFRVPPISEGKLVSYLQEALHFRLGVQELKAISFFEKKALALAPRQ